MTDRTALGPAAPGRRLVASLLAVLTAAGATACATAPATNPGLQPADHLTSGLVALEAADYNIAYDNLLEVRSVCGDSPMGQQALLVLAAAELDPRNPQRQIELAAEFAAHYLGLPNRAAWAQPLAEALYLLSMEIGASDAIGTLIGDARVDGREGGAEDGEPVTAMMASAGPNDSSLTDPGAARAETLRRAVFGFVPNPVPTECGVDWQQVADTEERLDLPVLPLLPVTERIAELEQERVDLVRRQGELEDEVETLETELARIRETLRP